jgi:hypothetical protein
VAIAFVFALDPLALVVGAATLALGAVIAFTRPLWTA